MVTPKVKCTIERATGVDLYSKPTLRTPADSKCAIVRLIKSSERTTVRADSSATRGKADEMLNYSKLLFLPQVAIDEGDRVSVAGLQLKVVAVHRRYNVTPGDLDHLEVDCEIWA